MMPTDVIHDLRNVLALRDLPEEHLQWIADHSEYHEYEDGDIVAKTGEEALYMMFMAEGSISFYMDKNGKLVHYFDFLNDNISGGASGLLPYSRMKKMPGTSFAVGKLRGYRMHKQYFQELERLNPELIQRLIGYMTERARSFATTQLQQEKVNALGRLAAGIAHELNNPAAAINRISEELTKRLNNNYKLTEKLLQNNISGEHLHSIQEMVEQKEKEYATRKKLSPMQRIEKEDELNDWLEQNGLHENNIAGETFVEAGFNGEDLEAIRNDAGKEAFTQVLLWIENLLSSQRVIKDLEEASTRISHLVGAIKSHVHMDQTSDLQPTDLHKDIENTLTLLGYKLREKNITVKMNFCDDLPHVPAYVGELNQVWTNLIDNAIYAMPKDGELTIETSCDAKDARIKIIDNGMGIPPEIINRIFDPFFTTKKMGEGTGIGLDLVKTVIKHHNGDIKVNSQPGRTEFTICLPLTETKKSNE
ncbi:MAG TPA: ATP-binding protein [Chitinophagaceae bacterium]|jgi:signal transduction histidine kinase|nr:ATP-binding protein [Chitinophagaceae bacterium]